jgi:hypothetical protein
VTPATLASSAIACSTSTANSSRSSIAS